MTPPSLFLTLLSGVTEMSESTNCLGCWTKLTVPYLPHALGRLALASNWLYHGLWCKVLGQSEAQRRIVEAVAGTGAPSIFMSNLIGLGEITLALWVLIGRNARACALVQTVLLIAMNGAGLAFGSTHITGVTPMLLANFTLIALAWNLVCTGTNGADHD